jgi:hypothetical protein
MRWLLQKAINAFRIAAQTIAHVLRIFRSAASWLIGPRDLYRWRTVAQRRIARLKHLNVYACGDFTLLAREDWFRLRGYPEWAIYSWHIDTVFMCAASANGMLEVSLGPKYRIYHIDHSLGSGWSLDGAGNLFGRIERNGVPYLSYIDLSNIRLSFGADPSAAIVNNANWGLIDIALPEREIVPMQDSNIVTADGQIDPQGQNLNAPSTR